MEILIGNKKRSLARGPDLSGELAQKELGE